MPTFGTIIKKFEMKKTIYLVAAILLLFSCKKEDNKPADNPTVINSKTSTTLNIKYGEGVNDIDGTKYKTVIIGTQEWMGENLNVSKYNDGTSIPNVINMDQWANVSVGAWSFHMDLSNGDKYGKLYNWFTIGKNINGNKNLCPTGWHIPSDAEWILLTDYLGGDTIAGGKMKELGITSWNSPNTSANNTSLFSALPGGYKDSDGWYASIGFSGFWWSSTEDSTGSCWARQLNCAKSNIYREKYDKKYGMSVRCLKD